MSTKKKTPIKSVSKDNREVIQALEKLHKSAWKQQRKKIQSEEYKEQFVSQVSGTANASN